MKYLDEYRDSAVASGLTKEIAKPPPVHGS